MLIIVVHRTGATHQQPAWHKITDCRTTAHEHPSAADSYCTALPVPAYDNALNGVHLDNLSPCAVDRSHQASNGGVCQWNLEQLGVACHRCPVRRIGNPSGQAVLKCLSVTQHDILDSLQCTPSVIAPLSRHRCLVESRYHAASCTIQPKCLHQVVTTFIASALMPCKPGFM